MARNIPYLECDFNRRDDADNVPVIIYEDSWYKDIEPEQMVMLFDDESRMCLGVIKDIEFAEDSGEVVASVECDWPTFREAVSESISKMRVRKSVQRNSRILRRLK